MVWAKWRKGSDVERPQPTVPEGQRIYAIGDVHGRADLLGVLAGLIELDLKLRPAPAARTIFLGDYVDRGPDSRAVVDRLVRKDFPTPVTALRGNHEDILIGFLSGQVDAGYHTQLGGDATLASYGIAAEDFGWAGAAARETMLHAAFSDVHCAFLDALPLTETVGDYFFCHAGVRPGVPLDRQSAEDLLWIREDFLRSEADFGKVVVHGHTPVREPYVRANAIDIDTHAFASGVLTALVLEGTDMRFLRTE